MTGNPEVISSPVGLVPTNVLVLTGLGDYLVELGLRSNGTRCDSILRVLLGLCK